MTYRSLLIITSVVLLFNHSGCSKFVGDLDDHPSRQEAGAPAFAEAGSDGAGCGDVGTGGRGSEEGRPCQGGADAMGGASEMQSVLPTMVSEKVYVIPAYVTLKLTRFADIAPGTIFKFAEGASLELVAVAPATMGSDDGMEGGRIVFTSLKDDSVGGDTNGDGTASQPNMDDWHGVVVSSKYAFIRYVDIRYSTWGLHVMSQNPTVQHSVFAHNHRALELDGEPTHNLMTYIEDNAFYANDYPLDISGNIPVDASNVFHDPKDTSVKNAYQIIRVTSKVQSPVKWSNTEVAFVFDSAESVFAVGDWGGLHLDSGVVFKFAQRSRMEIEAGGDFSYADTARFTSYADDSLLGDSNGDGPSAGGAGDWQGIYDVGAGRWIGGPNVTFAANPQP